MKNKLKLILLLCLCILLELFVYLLLHETGHAIVVLSVGGTIDEFSILGAHVSSHGGTFSNATELWLDANGDILPLLFSLIYLFLYRSKSKCVFYRLFSFYVGLFPVLSLVSWVLSPLYYVNAYASKGDDITKFMSVFAQYSSPVIVSVIAAVLIGICLLLMIRKRVIRNYIYTIKSFR